MPQGSVCLVTGATSGIGFAAAAELASRGAFVVLGCRDAERGRQSEAEIRERVPGAHLDTLLIEQSSLESVRSAAETFKKRHDRLHVLINNAGVWTRRRELSKDGFELTFAVNHLSHFLLTRLLLDVLKASTPSRIVNVSSGLHHGGRMEWDDLQLERSFGPQKAYARSKLANVLFTRELAKRLPASVTANSVHPGVISTGLMRSLPWPVRLMAKAIFASPETGAAPLVRLATDADVEGLTGRYFDKLKEKRASDEALDDAAAVRLWELSSRAVGLPLE
jgi:retinol dehydrogenase 12